MSKISFAGKTVIISGASRGIGKAIALKLAKHGANIVVAAKTAIQHPKLPGTIYSAVEEIQKLGGKGIACVMDIRKEADVEQTVETAVKEFGGIDFLVNNASAISLTGTTGTPMKKFDLMHSVNVRGTFLLSQKCIPYLKHSQNPHILNLSPPLLMEPQWFSRHVAYTMAKYGMSMCVLGMSEELKKYKIAVNALWPRTAIWTAAMDVLGADAAVCRKPEIVADAAYAILSRDSSEFTGHFMLDEEILKQEGVQDFDKYACKAGAKLMSDFFVPGVKYKDIFPPETGNDMKHTNEKKGTKTALEEKVQKARANDGKNQNSMEFSIQDPELQSIFLKLQKIMDEELVRELQAVFQFQFRDDTEVQVFFIDAKNGKGSVCEGVADSIDVAFEVDRPTFISVFHGELSPIKAFFNRDLRVKGDMAKALLLRTVIKKIQRSL